MSNTRIWFAEFNGAPKYSEGHMTPKHVRWFWLALGFTNFKATTGVKTNSPAGVKCCIGTSLFELI
jgi:hypothetical protein